MLPPGLHSQYSSQVGVNVKLMKLQILKLFLFSIALLISIQTWSLDPRVKLSKISSEHFDIIYDAKSYELAKIYLEEAERSHAILVNVFGISPEKTVVVLDDSYDIANGSAIGVPRPTINIFTSVPSPLSTVDHYSNWPRDVFLHEYAHILNMEPANGLAKPLRTVFGSIIRPNMFLPRWHLEGLAVEMESRFNEYGRLKSTDYDSLIRSLYLDSKWGKDNLSAVNEVSIPTWPMGQRPYFYGALIWHELIQSKSISVVQKFNDRYGARFPWVITEPMVDEFGKTYQDFLTEVYTKYEGLAQKQIAKIQEQPTTKGDVIATKEFVFNHSPEISPDGESLLFISQNQDGDSLLYIFKRLNDQWVPLKALNPTDIILPQQEVEKTEIQKAVWSIDGKKIIFDSVDTYDHTYSYYDLYTYDLETKKTKKITKGLRAREPAVSPDGKSIVFVKAGQGKTALYSVDMEGKNETVVYIPEGYDRVSRPAFLSATELVFALKNSTGVDRLQIVDLNSKKVTKILDFPAKYPVITASGIVFSSNQNGVENLYLTNKDFSSVRPLTNSLTRVVNGTIDPKTKKLIYSELTGDGPAIKQTEFPKDLKVLPVVAHPIAGDFKDKIQDAPELNPEQKNYHAFPYMFPQFWFPFVTFADGGTVASVTVPGADPTGMHAYLLEGEYHSKSEKFSTVGSYLWSNSLGQTVLYAQDRYKWYNTLKETTNSQGATLYHGFYLPGVDSNDWKAFLSYEYNKINLFRNFGSGPVKRNYYFDGPSIGFAFNNLEQKKLDITPYGQDAKVRFTHFTSNSTRTNYDETFARLTHYHKKWLPSRHALVFSAQGSYTEANRSLLMGTSSNDIEYVLGGSDDAFVTRGYPAGQFIGYTMASGSLEYRFPFKQIWEGPNNPNPYFIKRYHAAIFAETLTLRGVYFNELGTTSTVELGKYFTAAGLELKADATLFYHAPLTLRLILAYGFEKEAEGGFTTLFSIMAPQIF